MHDVLGEHPAITQERDDLTKSLGILKHATKVLQRDPDITNVISLDDKLERDLREESKAQEARRLQQKQPPQQQRDGGRSGRGGMSDMDNLSVKSSSDFGPPGGEGEPYERRQRESINPHMMRAQQQPGNQPLAQTQAVRRDGHHPQSQAKQSTGKEYGNLFG